MRDDATAGRSRPSITARTWRVAAVALVFAATLFVTACGSEGSLARKKQTSLLDSAMTDDVKVVVLEVFQSTAYVAVSERALNDLGHVKGVMEARRGLGSNEAYALVKTEVDPQTIVTAMEGQGYRAKTPDGRKQPER